MAEMGLVRKIDDLGRVVIPKEFRKTFNWPIGMEVEISAADGKVIVAKHSTACVFCGKPTRVQIGELPVRIRQLCIFDWIVDLNYCNIKGSCLESTKVYSDISSQTSST